mgnify:CR=1 FL=1
MSKVRRDVVAYGLVLAISLGWAYRTWTAPSEPDNGAKVVVLPGSTEELEVVTYRSDKVDVTLTAKEDTRAVWGWLWFERLMQDVRYGVRMLVRNPGFATIALQALAMKKPGMRGKTDASTTRSPSVPWTRKSLVTTPSASRGPMGHVPQAWCPHAVSRTNVARSSSSTTVSPGSSSWATRPRARRPSVTRRTNRIPSTTAFRSASPSLK